MKKYLLILIAALGFNLGVNAQGTSDVQLSLNYNIGIPMGEFSDFISNPSFRGLNLQVDYYLNDQFSIGGYVGWNGFYQKKDRVSYLTDNGALNGVRYNYLYQVPLYLKAQYILKYDGVFNPYVAVGVGGHYIEQETYIGYIGFANEEWFFGAAPEVGALMMMGQSGWSFKAAGIYHFTFYDRNNMSTIQNLGINLGFNYDF